MPGLFDDDPSDAGGLTGPNVSPASPDDGFLWRAGIAIQRSQLDVSDWWRQQIGKDWLAQRLQIEIAHAIQEAYRCGQRGVSYDLVEAGS